MGLQYAEFCTSCGSRKTRHPSGLCCECQKKARIVPGKMACKICGKLREQKEDGICSSCMSRIETYIHDEQRLQENALKELELSQQIIMLRKGGKSFESISAQVGLGKTAVYRRYRLYVPNEKVNIGQSVENR